MDLPSLLAPERIRCQVELNSKKRALQTVAELLGPDPEQPSAEPASSEPADPPPPSRRKIFDALIGRERLGSTGLGHGVALPHSRIAGIEKSYIALLTLASPVDFEAPDGQGVDIVCGLLVPEECNDEHLKILAELARHFNDPDVREKLRSFNPGDADALFAHLTQGASAA